MTSRISRRLTALLGAVAAVTALSACAPLLLGGAIVGSSMAIDRRTSGAQIDDQAIEIKGIKRVTEAVGDRSGSVSLTSYNHLVLITGAVPTEADKTAVEQAVARIESVRSVVNELGIGVPNSFGGRSNDTLLTSKIKASMIDAKDIQANAFKVVTERGIVYLMGRVSEREATRATDISRGVSGVRKVVRVFEIVSDAELADLQAKPAAAPAPAKP